MRIGRWAGATMLAAIAVLAMAGSAAPQELGSFVKAEMARWGEVVRNHSIKPE